MAELVTCGDCDKRVQREKAIWFDNPDFQNGDPERAWNGGPVIFCRSCWKKRPRRIAKIEKARRSRKAEPANV